MFDLIILAIRREPLNFHKNCEFLLYKNSFFVQFMKICASNIRWQNESSDRRFKLAPTIRRNQIRLNSFCPWKYRPERKKKFETTYSREFPFAGNGIAEICVYGDILSVYASSICVHLHSSSTENREYAYNTLQR